MQSYRAMRRRSLQGAFLVLCMGSLPAAPASFAATFDTSYIVPVPVRVGDYPSITLDAAGSPHIVYRRDIDLDGELRHATWTGSTWVKETVVDLSSNYASAAFSGSSLFASYQDPYDLTLRIASFNGSS